MANDSQFRRASPVRRILQAAVCLLLLALLVQLGWLYHGKTRRAEAAKADGRDVEISVATGIVSGKQHMQPAAPPVPSPAAAAIAPPAPPPTTAAAASLSAGASANPPASIAPKSPPGIVASALPPLRDAALAKIPPAGPVRSVLQIAPNPALIEVAGALALPKIGADGATPAQYYAKPFAATKEARIALIVAHVGLQETTTQIAEGLDENVTLAFSPYTSRLNQRIAEARSRGHEVWLDLPMQPDNYPVDDAGPYAIAPSETAQQNLTRLHKLMGAASGYVGFVSPAGGLAVSNTVMAGLTEDLRARGLMLLTQSDLLQLPQYAGLRLSIERVLPETATPEQFRQMLSELEVIAHAKGFAIGAIPDLPGYLNEAANWTRSLPAKHLALAPVSSVRPEAKP